MNVGKLVPESLDGAEEALMPNEGVGALIVVNSTKLLLDVDAEAGKDADNAGLADEDVVGVVKVDMIPFPLIG